MGNILGAAAKTKTNQGGKKSAWGGKKAFLKHTQRTFDEEHSLQPFGVVVLEHGEDLREGNRAMEKGTGQVGGALVWGGRGDKPLRKSRWRASRCASVRAPRSRRSG